MYQGASSEAAKANLLVMYQETIDTKIIPVAATVLPYNTASESEREAIHRLNHWILETAKTLGIPVYDTNRAVADPTNADRPRSSPDGLHPDASGYRAMGKALTHTIEAHLLLHMDSQTHYNSAATSTKKK